MRFQGLDLNLLSVLDALLTEQNITRAGARVHLSQPATSAALARLRSYFEDDLLVQVGRKMLLTPMGETLAQPIRDLLIQMRSTLENRGQFTPDKSTRKFKLMASDYVGMVLMPEVSLAMDRLAPQCSFELFSPTDEASYEIARGNVDFLLLPDSHIVGPHPSSELFEDEFVCVLWNGNPARFLSFDDYKVMGHVLVRWGAEHRALTVDDWFVRSFGFERKVDIITNTYNSVPPYLIGTNRIATMHKRLAERWIQYLPLKIVQAPWEAPTLKIAMQWNKHQASDPGLAWVRNLIIRTAHELA
jgi:LysR family nod box-dependent transcriptional activator